jgi:hypothetical protein
MQHKVAHDGKVQTLPIELRWHWVECLCLASENAVRGTLPAIRQIAYTMRLSEADTREVLAQLVEAGLIDDLGNGTWRAHDWDDHQKPSDTSNERVKRFRNAKKKAGVTTCNVTETLQKRSCNGPEEIRREEKRENTPPVPPEGAARAGLTSEDPETLSVCRWANDLVTGWGPLAEGACQTYPPAWVREACSIAREAKASRWKFVDSVLGRFKSQGGPDSARAPTTPRNTIAEKLGGGTLAERKARTKAIFEDLDRRNGVA